MDPNDVWVNQSRGDFRFIDEHIDELFVRGVLGVKSFDDEVFEETVQSVLSSEKDLGHPAESDPL
jgi:hypothetical protein